MKKIVLLLSILFTLSGLNNVIQAQCKPCPEFFSLTDSTCTRISIYQNVSVQPPGYVASDSIRACKGSKVCYLINADNFGCFYPAINYTFTVSGGTLLSSTGGQFCIQWGNTSPASVTIGFTIPGGAGGHCDGNIVVPVKLYDKPVPAFTFLPIAPCANNLTICFNAITSVGAASYFWDFGDGFFGTGVNPCHTYATPGSYIVTLIAGGTGFGGGNGTQPDSSAFCAQCIDSVKHTVTISNLPGPDIISCLGPVCPGTVSTYCTSATGCTYVWTVVGAASFTGQGTPCITVVWGSGNPQGSVTLAVSGCPGYCTNGTTVNIPIVPLVTTISGNIVACVGTTATYTLPAFPGASYSWSVNGGGTIAPFNTNTNQININWTTVGTWTITCNYYDSSIDCGGVGTLVVNVLPAAAITGINKFCAGSSTTLSSAPYSSTWSVTPAGASVVTGPGTTTVVTSSVPGIYTVTATPTPGTACNVPTYIVTVLPKPLLTPIVGKDSVCDGQPYVYAVGSNTVGAFNWTVNNGTFTPLSGLADSIQVTWTGPSHSITVTQTSAAGCTSLPKTFTAAAYPTPNIAGAVSVCADNVETYTITNIGNHPFIWSVNPANLGTVISGQGTNVVQIKWHGSNLPGSSNTVYLHYGLCKDDSIAITINEPVLPVITRTGTLCSGGVNLSVAATGVFSWSCSEHAIVPTQPLNTSSIIGLTLPGHYTVTISNYNGSGCTVSNTYFVQDIGRPVASISASNVLNYCLPSTPNMNIVAAYALGYSYQWYGPGGPIGGPTINPTLPVNAGAFPIFNTPGSYSFYVVVTLGGCVVTSNTITINIVTPCPNPPPGCTGAIAITNITGCNPFTLSLAATAPAGGVVLPLTATIFYNGPVYPATSGTTTLTFDSVGYKQITICADIALPGGGTTRCCKDTVVLVKVAAKYLANNNCGVVTLTDLSTVIFPAVISSYSWTNGTYPANLPVPPVVAVFNNPAIANPVDTFKVSGTYYINQTITSGTCTVTYSDSITVTVPNATFTANNSCVGTPINLTAPGGFTSYYWDFGDAATSYTQTTAHAYAAVGPYTITLTVTDANGCTATSTQTVTIIAKPVCAITPANPPPFCQGDSVVLNACAGFTGYQWYKNGTAILLANGLTYTALQTGSYSFTALNGFGCIVSSDTVDVLVNPAPNVVIATSGSICVGGVWLYSVPSCGTCTYVWKDNGVPFDNTNSGSYNILAAGVHVITVKVTNTTTGCSATGTTTVTFYDNPTVSISVMPNPPQLCSNNIYVLTATAGAIPPVSLPSWAWTYNPNNFVISTNNFISVNAAGTYNVTLTDGVTGCKGTASQIVLPSPDLSLFPMGCDTLCDTAHVFLPLPTVNNNYAGYTITWYNNAPPYTSIIGTGPSISLASLPLGNNSISVIVVSPNGCVDTSNNYNIFIKHCGGCNCDQSHWGETTWEQDTAEVTNPIENVIIPHVLHPFKCGDDLGNINCLSPILIKAQFFCNPASCNKPVTYTLTGPVTQTGVLPFSTAGLPSGNYVLTMIGKCGDSVCKTCVLNFHIVCDTVTNCCTNSHWTEGPTWLSTAFQGGLGVSTVTPIICNQSNFSISNIVGNCTTPTSVVAAYACNAGCTSNIQFNLYNTVGNVLVASSTTSPFTIPTSLPNGSYCITIYAYCGGVICDSCKFCFVKNCGNCCDLSHWEGETTQFNVQPGNANCPPYLPDTAYWQSTPVTLGCIQNTPDTIFISSALGNCCLVLDLFQQFRCPPGCQSHSEIIITDASGNVLVTANDIAYGNANGGVSYLWALNPLPNGVYTITSNGYCGGVLCKTCTLTVIKNCRDCCEGSYFNDIIISESVVDDPAGNEVFIDTIHCGANVPDTLFIDPAHNNCNKFINIKAGFTSPDSCELRFVFELSFGGAVIDSGVLLYPSGGYAQMNITWLPSATFTVNGIYTLCFKAYIGGVLCKQCCFTIVKNCPPNDCCTNSHWAEGPTWLSTAMSGGLGISTVTPIICGQSSFAINNTIGNCTIPTTVTGSYVCGAGCTSSVVYNLYKQPGNVLISTSTGSLTIPVALPNGSYSVTIYAYCGTKICDSCKFTFVKNCTDCCKNSKWSSGPFWVNGNTGVKTLVKCGTSRFNILSTNNLCFVPFKVNGTYLCGGAGCSSQTVYELKDSTSGLVVSTSNDSLLIPVALPNGTYFVTIKAYCGGVLCNTCTFVIVKNCECDCGPTTGVISVTLTTNGSPKAYKCGAVLPVIDCKDSIVMSGSYACNQTGCPASYTYVLNGPFGTTSGSLPLTLTSLAPGTYSIFITAYCGGKICKECKYNFTVKCDTVPPPPCCPYEIGVVANAPLYAILSVTPQLTTAVVSENFSFTGIAGVPITELRAEVVSYSLSSNYMNECMNCKNYPRNWASVSSGTKVDTITPKITMFGGTTTNSFTPTTSNVYQNPREIIWNNGGTFAAPDSVAINFLIPGPSPIDCCVLNGRICVKFTFRDIKCRECEVIVCFPFRISQENGGVIYTRE